jgi:hypothetical protein
MRPESLEKKSGKKHTQSEFEKTRKEKKKKKKEEITVLAAAITTASSDVFSGAAIAYL